MRSSRLITVGHHQGLGVMCDKDKCVSKTAEVLSLDSLLFASSESQRAKARLQQQSVQAHATGNRDHAAMPA